MSDQTPMSVPEREARIDECRSRQREIHSENDGLVLTDALRGEFETLAAEIKDHEFAISELKAREDYLEGLSTRDENRESGAHFQIQAKVARGEDPYDLTTVDRTVGPADQARELRDRALKSIERMEPAHPEVSKERAQDQVEHKLATAQKPYGDPGYLARYLLQTGSPVYERAWHKVIDAQLNNRPPILSAEESFAIAEAQRGATVGTGSGGGFAVPYTLDPTLILTGNYSVNPMRAISRVETIAGSNEWRGVSSGDLTATRRAELAEVGDNMTTLAQPTAIVSRVDAFVPFSFEVDQDWSGFRSEVARLFAQSKDNEEATSFVTGNGTAPNPQGIITGATNVYTTAGTAAFVVADLYGTKNALPPRFRPNAQYVAEQSIYDRIRQFDTQGGASIWIDNLQLGTTNDAIPTPGNLSARVLGKPANEASAMASTLATGSLILAYGDFSYYLIVDRIGMSVEVVPHLFGTANQRPLGQRGLLAFWRNTGKVLSAAAFRVTKTL